MPKFYILIWAAVMAVGSPTFANSGSGCAATIMGEEGHRKAAQMAAQVVDYLDHSGAQVALLGRAGSASPRKRFTAKVGFWDYTHAGLVYRHHPDGEWTVVHLLNICNEESGVFAESLLKFYLDDPFEYRTVIAIPAPALQQALHNLIVDKNVAAAYRNHSVYSSISYPYTLERQNSNEYILDTLAGALALMDGKTLLTRQEAKDYFLTAHRDDFEPEILKTGFFESIGASMGFGPGNATLSDHTSAERRAGRFEFVSVGAITQFMDNLGLLQTAEELALPDISQAKDTRKQK